MELVADDIATQVQPAGQPSGRQSRLASEDACPPALPACPQLGAIIGSLLPGSFRLQCQLLTEVCDAELEEELQEGATPASRLSLTQVRHPSLWCPITAVLGTHTCTQQARHTAERRHSAPHLSCGPLPCLPLMPQDFPFEGCPPTKAGPCHSPGLQRLTAAVCGQLGGMTAAERNSLIRVGAGLQGCPHSSPAPRFNLHASRVLPRVHWDCLSSMEHRPEPPVPPTACSWC